MLMSNTLKEWVTDPVDIKSTPVLAISLILSKVTYRTQGSNFIVGSPAFNYGSASYDFATGKVNKGASIEKMSFKDFKKYIFDIIK